MDKSYKYIISKDETTHAPHITYGIRCEDDSHRIIKDCPDISCDRNFIKKTVSSLNRLSLSPLHFDDFISDLILTLP